MTTPSITYPLVLPSAGGSIRGPSKCTITPIAVTAVAESPFTLSQQVQVFPGQRWNVDITLPVMKQNDAEPWLAFLLSLNGRQGTFLVGDPLRSQPRGAGSGSPVVNGSNQTGNTLITNGWSSNVTGILKAGDYFHMVVGGKYRLHKLLQDASSDGSGNATLIFWPSLRESPPSGTSLVVQNTVGQFRQTVSQNPWAEDVGGFYTIAFSGVEVI